MNRILVHCYLNILKHQAVDTMFASYISVSDDDIARREERTTDVNREDMSIVNNGYCGCGEYKDTIEDRTLVLQYLT